MLNVGRSRMALIALGALLLSGSGVYGEEAPALEPGARVRVFVTDGAQGPGAAHTRRLTGTLLGLSDTVLTLEKWPGTPAVVLPRQNVTRLDLSLHRGQRGKGALIGLGAGVGLGLLLGLAAGDDKPGFFAFTAGEKAGMFAMLLGPLGTLVGVVAAPGEKWQAVPPDRIRLGLDGTLRRERGASLALRF
jgi:hypothetical protein